MGQGSSKVASGRIGTEEGSIKVHCRMEKSMEKTLVIPDDIAEKYFLKFETCVGIKDSEDGVYCCNVEEIDGKFHLTKGWSEFLCSTGVVVGDCMVFDVKGADETVVWLFRGSSREGVCADVEKDVAPKQGMSNVDGLDVTALQGTEEPNDEEGTEEIRSRNGSDISVTLGDDDTEEETGAIEGDMREVLEEWRAHMVVAKNVDLEDWMVEYVASGQNWEMPPMKIYIGRLEDTSVANNRLRLPRSYTTENVLPLLKTRNESFVLQGRDHQDRLVKFCIGKDGRATFSMGWKDFAIANGVGGGSIIAYIFGRKNSELDVEIEVIQKA